MNQRSINPREAAETLAVSALSFLTRDPDRLGRFLAVSGLGPDSIRAAAHEPGFLVSVLEHLLADEPLLLIFCEEESLRPQSVWHARLILGGMPPQHD